MVLERDTNGDLNKICFEPCPLTRVKRLDFTPSVLFYTQSSKAVPSQGDNTEEPLVLSTRIAVQLCSDFTADLKGFFLKNIFLEPSKNSGRIYPSDKRIQRWSRQESPNRANVEGFAAEAFPEPKEVHPLPSKQIQVSKIGRAHV